MSNRVANCVSAHCFSPDGSQIAVSPNTEEVWIFDVNGTPGDCSGWKRTSVLSNHMQAVSGLDWSINNQLVSVSHDRQAYVWSFVEGEWLESLVELRAGKAAVGVRWAPDGTKFVVSTSAREAIVCFWSHDNACWISKKIVSPKATVMDACWHPSGHVVLVGGIDRRCFVGAAHISGFDETAGEFAGKSLEGVKIGERLLEVGHSHAWAVGTAFSPTGKEVAVCYQDGTVAFQEEGGESVTIRHRGLPFCKIMFVSAEAAVAVGFDYEPVAFVKTSGQWQIRERGAGGKGGSGGYGQQSAQAEFTSFKDAKNMFQSKERTGGESSSSAKSTKHDNVITQLHPFETSGDRVIKFTTSGLDGRVVLWTASELGI
mmetsp:Transcript_22880/g.50224  ORF Transcript_22880/g.50224 Transcript_22880/m.50224 type:complete len:372 (+) Transcript_22880:37-1152(+)